jgi:hypothetical protein
MGKLNAFVCGLCFEGCLVHILQGNTTWAIIEGLFAITNGVLAVINDD